MKNAITQDDFLRAKRHLTIATNAAHSDLRNCPRCLESPGRLLRGW